MKDGDTFVVTEGELGLDGAQPDVAYTLRLMPIEELKAIRRRNTPKVRSPRTGTLVSGETEPIDFGFDCFDYCLVDWRGIELEGQPVACTRDMKRLLAKDNSLVTAIGRRCGFGDGAGVAPAEELEDSFRGAP
jgi:hypothetical protein